MGPFTCTASTITINGTKVLCLLLQKSVRALAWARRIEHSCMLACGSANYNLLAAPGGRTACSRRPPSCLEQIVISSLSIKSCKLTLRHLEDALLVAAALHDVLVDPLHLPPLQIRVPLVPGQSRRRCRSRPFPAHCVPLLTRGRRCQRARAADALAVLLPDSHAHAGLRAVL